jgi:predicted O-linked N-acetylglucosamine transferase (SPINDLY family)
MKNRHVRLLETAAAHLRAGELEDAVKACRRMLAESPANFDCTCLLATVYARQGNLRPAVAMFRRASELKPDAADVRYNLAVALGLSGDYEEAARHYRHLLETGAGNTEARNNYAGCLLKTNRHAEALAEYDKLIASQPAIAAFYLNRAAAFDGLRRYDQALSDYDKAVALDPNNPEAHYSLGRTLGRLGLATQALASYKTAIALRPNFSGAYNGRLYLSDWSDLDALSQELVALAGLNPPDFPVGTAAISSSPQELLRCAEMFNGGRAAPAQPHRSRGKPIPRRKIRIAYVSADFHVHATAHLMAGMFEHHDRTRFEVAAFSYGPNDRSDMRQRLEDAFDVFVDAAAMTDDDVARRIADDEIDIAIDLKGLIQGARTGILARRPCPIQVNYLGYPGTMGAPWIDYLIADRTIVPASHRQYYAEKVVTLPDTYQANDSKREISNRRFSRAEAGLPADDFVFCSFNANYKIMPHVFDIWMRLLGAVNGSVLWLFAENAAAAANLRNEAAARGIDPARLVFAEHTVLSDHLARFRLADLVLDTSPFNGHTTTSDALWAGVPVLTLSGETFASRVGASLLTAIGLVELIVHSQGDYERTALELATRPGLLAATRAKLSQNRLTTALFDTKRFTRNIERAYVAMIERQHAGLAPDHIDIV